MLLMVSLILLKPKIMLYSNGSYGILSWLDKNIDGIWYRFNSCQSDYGFFGLYQVKQMSQINDFIRVRKIYTYHI